MVYPQQTVTGIIGTSSIRTRIVMVYQGGIQKTKFIPEGYSYKNCYGLSIVSRQTLRRANSIRTRIVMVYLL